MVNVVVPVAGIVVVLTDGRNQPSIERLAFIDDKPVQSSAKYESSERRSGGEEKDLSHVVLAAV